MSNSLKLDRIFFRYEGVVASQNDVLKGISLELGANECVAIVGPSGSGKTTLIQHFTGLLRPTGGTVTFNGQDIWARSFRQVELRKKIGLVFQFPEAQLFEETVEKDIAFGPINFGLPPAIIEERVLAAMQAVDLNPEYFRRRSPFRISEGEKRRVAIAGVLAMQPDMLVFDEPTAGLDPQGVQRFARMIKRLLNSGKSIVVVTHNMDFVAEVANRVLVLSRGELLFSGAPAELFSNLALVRQADLELPAVLQTLQEWEEPLPEEMRAILSYEQLVNYLKLDLRNPLN
jgi:energy-coupling factor transport system ATP-binding protein